MGHRWGPVGWGPIMGHRWGPVGLHRLQVAMDDILGVQVGEGGAELREDARRDDFRQRPTLQDHVEELRARQAEESKPLARFGATWVGERRPGCHTRHTAQRATRR